MSSARSSSVASRVFDVFERFLHIVLLTAAVAALLWANSPFSDAYQDFWHAPLTAGAGAWVVAQPLHFWINDGLMAVFPSGHRIGDPPAVAAG